MSKLPTQSNPRALAASDNLSPMERVWITGDLTPLSPEERVKYYVARCERSGLDPATQPFEYMELQGKLVLYAKKTATDQLALQHKLSVTITDQGVLPGAEEHYYARARVTSGDGRVTEDQAVLWLMRKFYDKRKPFGSPPEIVDLEGEELSNAIMKCITKAKRRAIIAHTGLGMLDESETETIRNEKENKAKTQQNTLNVDSGVVREDGERAQNFSGRSESLPKGGGNNFSLRANLPTGGRVEPRGTARDVRGSDSGSVSSYVEATRGSNERTPLETLNKNSQPSPAAQAPTLESAPDAPKQIVGSSKVPAPDPSTYGIPRETQAAAGEPFTFPRASVFAGMTLLQVCERADTETIKSYLLNLESKVLAKAKKPSALQMTGEEYDGAATHKMILNTLRAELENRVVRDSVKSKVQPQTVVGAEIHDPDTSEETEQPELFN